MPLHGRLVNQLFGLLVWYGFLIDQNSRAMVLFGYDYFAVLTGVVSVNLCVRYALFNAYISAHWLTGGFYCV